jgi:hypothetical protein
MGGLVEVNNVAFFVPAHQAIEVALIVAGHRRNGACFSEHHSRAALRTFRPANAQQ